MLNFDLFSMRTKVALYLYNVSIPKNPLAIEVSARFASGECTKNSRYFAIEKLACVELRFDKRLLCLDIVQRTGTSVMLNLTDWVIKSGKARLRIHLPVPLQNLSSGMTSSLNLSGVYLHDVETDNYRKMLAQYEIM